MSSALNIYYREPEKFEVSGEASLIGGRLTTGLASKIKNLPLYSQEDTEIPTLFLIP
jgi:hypothetical protein